VSASGPGVLAAADGDARSPRGGTSVPDALQGAITAITAGGCETPRLDAEILLADALGVSRERLLTDSALRVQGPAVRAFQSAVRRRAVEREPVAYIIGRRPFRHLELEVDPRVLIPRPETELLVEAGLELAPGTAVLDVCTGGGAVALALKQERPDLDVWGSELSEDALSVARANAQRLGLEVGWLHADLLDGVPDRFEAVLANPPYVSDAERPGLAPEITRHEPAEALFAGPDGLDVIDRLVTQLGARPGIRTAAIEVGEGHADAVARRMRDAGFEATGTELDLRGIKRVVIGRKGRG
jgi:release factor glutamine methyltransferase